MQRTILILVVALGLVATACGSGIANSDGFSPAVLAAVVGEGDSGAEGETFWFGEAADPKDAVKIIEVDASDEFRFSPTALAFRVGDVVTFRVTNRGNLPHEFTLGDFEVQLDHEAEMMAAATEMEGMEMAMMEGMDGDPNAIAMFPGDTVDITWRFTTPGWILMGCHVPGHYTAGMRGTILIEA